MSTTKGRSFELFFINGKPDGMLTAQVPFQWTGHVLMTRRSQVKEALGRKEATRTGIYILLGENDEGSLVYIGETEEIRQRIIQHAQNKDWWDTAVLITDADDQLNKAHVKYLESRLIGIARTVGKIKLENGTTPPLPSLTEAAICNMEGFLENVLLVLPALRIDYFLADTRPAVKTGKAMEQQQDLPVFVLHTKKHGIHATAVLDGGDFVVQAGSHVKADWTGVKHHSYAKPADGDILITREAPVGEVCALPSGMKACLGQRMMLYRPNVDVVSSQLLLCAGGPTVGHVRVGDIRSLPIPVSPKEVQEKIVTTLGALDSNFQVEQAKLDQLKRVKKGLMVDLLTGKKRVIV